MLILLKCVTFVNRLIVSLDQYTHIFLTLTNTVCCYVEMSKWRNLLEGIYCDHIEVNQEGSLAPRKKSSSPNVGHGVNALVLRSFRRVDRLSVDRGSAALTACPP